MFNRRQIFGKTPYYFPITGAKGSGITPQIEERLNNIIADADDDNYCDCGDSIWSLLGPLSSWSFLCYDEPSDAMYYAYVLRDQYYSVKGKNCYFAMWREE